MSFPGRLPQLAFVWDFLRKSGLVCAEFMPGICTSAMTQDVSFNWGEDKNSCAEANAYTENPIDLSNRAVAVRTEESSSMTEMTGASATRPDLF